MRNSTRIVIAALSLALAAPLWADTYPRQNGFRVTNYNFTVALSDASNELTVSEVVDLHFTAAGVASLMLDLCQLRTAPENPNRSNPCLAAKGDSAGTGMKVTAVTSGGAALHFDHDHDVLRIDFPHASQAGENLSISLDYHGTPANGILIGDNRYGDRGFVTNPWPDHTRNWLAVIDHPYMKAPKELTITAPNKYQVISNGTRMEVTDLPNGLRRTVWKESVPIATWQYSLAAAPFAVDYFGTFHGIPMSAWVFPQEREASFKAFSEYTEPILEFYIDHIGPYSYEKLAQVEANGVGGGMELASDIFYGYAPSGPGRQLLAHEMAHQWFGDSATEADWNDVWLSEGFATYFALLYQEHQDGRDAFIAGVKQSAASALRYYAAHPDSPLVHQNLNDVSQVIANNAQIYQGGAQVLHMLRGVVGNDNFWAGIRLYYSRFRDSNATSLDFEHAMEDGCSCDLAWYFPEWLHRGGVLQVNGTWHYDETAKQLEVTLDQTSNSGSPYRMPFQLGIEMPPAPPAAPGAGGRGGRGRGAAAPAPPPVVWMKQAHNTFTLPLASAPTNVVLDPQSWVTLAEIHFAPR